MRYYAIKCAQYAIISFTTGFVGYRQHSFAGILQNYQEKIPVCVYAQLLTDSIGFNLDVFVHVTCRYRSCFALLSTVPVCILFVPINDNNTYSGHGKKSSPSPQTLIPLQIICSFLSNRWKHCKCMMIILLRKTAKYFGKISLWNSKRWKASFVLTCDSYQWWDHDDGWHLEKGFLSF